MDLLGILKNAISPPPLVNKGVRNLPIFPHQKTGVKVLVLYYFQRKKLFFILSQSEFLSVHPQIT